MSISATIFGRLTGDPEQKQPQNGGNPYVTFSIASNTGKKDNNNNSMAQFVNISVFGKQGETIMQYFHKGSRIAAHVRDLEVRAWTGQQDGQAHANLNAVLTGFDFIDTAAESGVNNQHGPNNQQQGSTPPSNNNYGRPGYAPAQAPNYGPAAPYPQTGYAPGPTAAPQNYPPANNVPPAAPPQNYGRPATAPAVGTTPWS